MTGLLAHFGTAPINMTRRVNGRLTLGQRHLSIANISQQTQDIEPMLV